jgi:hypothetical protein
MANVWLFACGSVKLMEKTKYMGKYKHQRARGITFVFKYDDIAPEHLHIYARHLTSPRDAITAFFASKPQWNDKNQRFETYSDTHVVYWFWLKKDAVVMIISCIRL